MTAGGMSNCRSNCTRCGDGVVDPQETCDDGNTNDNDGCSATCQNQAGWDCSVPGQLCTEICDDGLTVGSEECDPPNSIDCPWGASQAASEAACNYCTPACRNGQGIPHYCGDGSTDAPNEACDDAIPTTTTLAATIVRRRSVVMAFWIQPMVVSENQTVLFVMTATRPVVTVARPVVK